MSKLPPEVPGARRPGGTRSPAPTPSAPGIPGTTLPHGGCTPPAGPNHLDPCDSRTCNADVLASMQLKTPAQPSTLTQVLHFAAPEDILPMCANTADHGRMIQQADSDYKAFLSCDST